MMSKITPEDILKLGKTQTCSSYVFMMADSIQKLFDDLRIRPKRAGDSGVVLFQKVDTLRAQTAESRQLCLQIAYFQIRVFQIFAALAITVLDDPGAGAILGAVRQAPRPSVPSGVAGLFGRQAARQPGARGAFLSGGAPESEFRAGKALTFKPLKDLLQDREMDPQASADNPRWMFRFAENEAIQLIPERKEKETAQNLRVELSPSSRLQAQMTLTPISVTAASRKYRVALSNFRQADSAFDAASLLNASRRLNAQKPTFDIVSIDGGATQTSGNKPLIDVLNNQIEILVAAVQELLANPGLSVKDVVAIPKTKKEPVYVDAEGFPYQAQTKDELLAQMRRRKPLADPREFAAAARAAGVAGAAAQGRDVIGVPKGLQNDYLVATLKAVSGQKTLAFCVARALQLLDANTLATPKPLDGKSGICTLRFDPMPSAVPQVGQSLDKVPGLRAVDQLFQTRAQVGTQDVGQVAVENDAQYADFLKTMLELFGKPATAQPASLDKIIAKDPNCQGAAAKHYLQLTDPKGIQKVVGIVNTMFGRQLTHTQKVIQFQQNRLFRIKKTRDPATGGTSQQVELHPRLLQGGLSELSALSKAARDLLIDYQKGCEELQQKGVQEVLRTRFTPLP